MLATQAGEGNLAITDPYFSVGEFVWRMIAVLLPDSRQRNRYIPVAQPHLFCSARSQPSLSFFCGGGRPCSWFFPPEARQHEKVRSSF